MNKLIRYINQNWKKIGLVIVIIAFAIILIQLLNYIAKQPKKEDNQSEKLDSIYNPSETIIKGSDIGEKQELVNEDIINKFVSYCNAKDPNAAYNLLSQNCKQNLYPSLDSFINTYYNIVFKEQMMISMQSWINSNSNYTYKVRILKDPMATGNYDDTGVYEDYMTIVKENDEQKLNINNYIKRDEIKKEAENNGIKIKVNSIDQYKDYQIYNFTVENKTNKNILVNTNTRTNSVYLVDANNNMWSSQMYEISVNQLEVIAGGSKNISIKFGKNYNPDLGITGVVFSDIVPDSTQYFANNQYQDRLEVKIQ